MQLNIFDTISAKRLLPFTHTRPVADIRCGILTQRERWEKLLNLSQSGTITGKVLSKVFPPIYNSDNLYVNAAILANEAIAEQVAALQNGEALVAAEVLIALRTSEQLTLSDFNNKTISYQAIPYEANFRMLQNVWDIFGLADEAIRYDFNLLSSNVQSEALPAHNTLIGSAEDLFIAKGAQITAAILNTTTGPIFIDEDAEVMEGAMLRGPIYLGKHGAFKMGTKVYGATSIGHHSKVGGELSNVIMFDYSNKGHDGYLGNAVIGSWCNLGADTNASNLKNNYDEVSIWSEYENRMVKTGTQFCGLLMGDHSKCGINTMFNTGTVVGVSCNIYGGDFPDKYIPSFSWGGKNDMTSYQFDKAIDTARRMMARRGKQPTAEEIEVLASICEKSQRFN